MPLLRIPLPVKNMSQMLFLIWKWWVRLEHQYAKDCNVFKILESDFENLLNNIHKIKNSKFSIYSFDMLDRLIICCL